MRILLLSQWCAPEPDVRIYPLASALAERGHDVRIITGFPNYPHGQIYPGHSQKLWQWEQHNGVKILRLMLYPDHSRSSLKRAFSYLSFALSASVIGAALCGPADVMWVYHPPLTVSIPASLISLLRRIPFVYEIQDMWPETIKASGMLSSPAAIWLIDQLAQFAYRSAWAITVISPGFKEHLIKKSVPAEKISFIPNWSDEEIYRPAARDQELGEKYGFAGRFNIMFAGNMGPAQSLEILIQAAVLIKERTNIQFILIGDGIATQDLKDRVEQLLLSNVRFIGRQAAQEMPKFFAWADALLVQLRDDPLFHMTIPSKTLAYMACGRPILCAVAGDGAKVILEAGAGIVCPPSDPLKLAETVLSLYDMKLEDREALGIAGRKAFLKSYTRQVLVDKYESLFQGLVKIRSSSQVANGEKSSKP